MDILDRLEHCNTLEASIQWAADAHGEIKRLRSEVERLRAENRTLRNVGISQMEQINRLLAAADSK